MADFATAILVQPDRSLRVTVSIAHVSKAQKMARITYKTTVMPQDSQNMWGEKYGLPTTIL